MSKLFYKEYAVQLQHKPKLKNTYIGIEMNNTIVVKTSSSSSSYVLNLLQARDSWIQKQFNKQNRYITLDMNLEDELLLFGQKYSIDSQEALYLRKKLHSLRTSSQEKVLKCYDDFYKTFAKEYVKERVEYFSKIMGLSYETIKYRKMKSRWGSCSSKKVLTFNTQLMKVSKKMIDYVVVHELAHLQHMNHSKKFHAFVELYLADSKQIRKELKLVRLR